MDMNFILASIGVFLVTILVLVIIPLTEKTNWKWNQARRY